LKRAAILADLKNNIQRSHKKQVPTFRQGLYRIENHDYFFVVDLESFFTGVGLPVADCLAGVVPDFPAGVFG
jgi:hypothetical protein